jgi:hypothetical protein
MHDLPEDMMDKIYKRAYMRKGQERHCLDFAAVVTDGNDIIAFDTIGYQIPVRKSRLIPRQEQLVFDMIKTTKPESWFFFFIKKKKKKKKNSQGDSYLIVKPPICRQTSPSSPPRILTTQERN